MRQQALAMQSGYGGGAAADGDARPSPVRHRLPGHLDKILRRPAGQRRWVRLDIVFDLQLSARAHGVPLVH